MSEDLRLNLTPDEQYLWDGTGTPVPATLAIESALRSQQFSGRPLAANEKPPLIRRWLITSFAAVLLLSFIGNAVYYLWQPVKPNLGGWTVSFTAGTPNVQPTEQNGLHGAHVVTDASSHLTLKSSEGPQVDIGPGTDAQFNDGPTVAIMSGRATISVAAGQPPTKVNASSLTCTVAPSSSVTIACADGADNISVSSGWAEVKSGNENLRLSDSMGCSSSPKSGGIWPPYRIEKSRTPGSLTKDIDAILNSKMDDKSQYFKLEEVLKAAKPQDAALLWNLLPRLQEWQRSIVRDRLAKLVKDPPKGEAYESVLKLDAAALDQWWNAIIAK